MKREQRADAHTQVALESQLQLLAKLIEERYEKATASCRDNEAPEWYDEPIRQVAQGIAAVAHGRSW